MYRYIDIITGIEEAHEQEKNEIEAVDQAWKLVSLNVSMYLPHERERGAYVLSIPRPFCRSGRAGVEYLPPIASCPESETHCC